MRGHAGGKFKRVLHGEEKKKQKALPRVTSAKGFDQEGHGRKKKGKTGPKLSKNNTQNGRKSRRVYTKKLYPKKY